MTKDTKQEAAASKPACLSLLCLRREEALEGTLGEVGAHHRSLLQ